jgi:hypothetical protein
MGRRPGDALRTAKAVIFASPGCAYADNDFLQDAQAGATRKEAGPESVKTHRAF